MPTTRSCSPDAEAGAEEEVEKEAEEVAAEEEE
jgi:hypothetical protein